MCKDGLSLQKEDDLKWQVEISAFFSRRGFDSSRARAALGLSPISWGLLGALDLGLLQRGGRAGLGGEPDAFSSQFMSFSAWLSAEGLFFFFLPTSFQSPHRSEISFCLPQGKLQISLPLTELCFQEKPGAALRHVQAQKCSGCVYFLCSGQSQSCCRC